jgi:hypothetical protein
MAEYTAQDLKNLNASLSSAGEFDQAQMRLFEKDFRSALEELTSNLRALGYGASDLHRHGVLLGILLAEHKHRDQFEEDFD